MAVLKVTNVKGTFESGKETTGFMMDGYLVSNLLGLPSYLKKKWDVVGIVSGHGKVRVGKCQIKGSKVLMADGSWKNIEDIKQGDEVISPDVKTGKHSVAKVVETHSRFCDDIYDVYNKSKNKVLYSCAGNHDIPVEYTETIRLPGNRGKGEKRQFKFMEAKEIASKNLSWLRNKGLVTYQGFLIDKFASINATIEPYSLGVYLGDGNCFAKRESNKKESNRLVISCSSEEVMCEVSKHYPLMSIGKYPHKNNQYRFSINSDFFKELIKYKLENKVSGNKFIPYECKRSDMNYRLRLLAGLIDTDGYIDKRGIITYTTKSLILARDIQDICRSLGGNCNIVSITKAIKSRNFSGKYYNVQINLGKLNSSIPLNRPFKVKRIKENQQEKNKIGIVLKKGNAQMVYGFQLDSESKLYITNDYTVTHNSTMAFQVATFIAWLLAGGELELDVSKDEHGKTHFVKKREKNPTKPLRFTLDENVVFSAIDLKTTAEKLYNKYGKNQIILYDEGREGLEGARAMENLNKVMQDFFQECGFMGHIILIVLPNFFKLHEDYAVSRSVFLIDTLHDKYKRRGWFNFYTERGKEWLYFLGKKRIGISQKYSASRGQFYGRFTSWFPFDRQKYEVMKAEALKKRAKSRSEVKFTKQRNALMYWCNEKLNHSQDEIAQAIKDFAGTEISPDAVSLAVIDVRERLKKS